MRIKFLDAYESFYFIGIGGVSMSGLAKYLLSLGKKLAVATLFQTSIPKS